MKGRVGLWHRMLAAILLLLAGTGLVGACHEQACIQGLYSCVDFPGSTGDMLAVDWGLAGPAESEFAATMQAIHHLSVRSSAELLELGQTCRGLAMELGASEAAITGTDPRSLAREWCGAAAALLAPLVAENGASVEPARCFFDAESGRRCSLQCQVDPACDPGSTEARCAALAQRCAGSCSGVCLGSATAAVGCVGHCDGACEGACSTGGAAVICEGKCDGACRGACTPDAPTVCDGVCVGGCAGGSTAPRCVERPSASVCDATSGCRAACAAVMVAQAACPFPAVAIGGPADDSRLNVARGYLPLILRASPIADELEALDRMGETFPTLNADAVTNAEVCRGPAFHALHQGALDAAAAVEARGLIAAAVQ